MVNVLPRSPPNINVNDRMPSNELLSKLKPHHVLVSDVRLEPSFRDRRDRAQTPALNTLTGTYYDIPRTPEIG